MNALSFKQMEVIDGGGISCGEGWGIAAGLFVGGLAVATLVTGGVAAGAVLAAWAVVPGAPIAGINCIGKR